MNLSDFIDLLLKLEHKHKGFDKCELPVYVVDARSGDSVIVQSAFVDENKYNTQGDLLDYKRGAKYIEVTVG